MLTGQTEKQVVVDSRKAGAGAVDFVANPFNRDLLLKRWPSTLPNEKTP